MLQILHFSLVVILQSSFDSTISIKHAVSLFVILIDTPYIEVHFLFNWWLTTFYSNDTFSAIVQYLNVVEVIGHWEDGSWLRINTL